MARRKGSARGAIRSLSSGANWRAVLLLASCSIAPGCSGMDPFSDPVLDADRDALGPEDPNVAVGPLHRAGQPCAVCHRDGGDEPAFAFAGTVYRDPMDDVAVPDAKVMLTDSAGHTFMTTTNCVGNFYVKTSEFRATTPVWASVQAIDFPWNMESPIHREASCAKCHYDPIGPASAGHLFVTDDETTFASVPMRACTDADGKTR